MNVKKNLMASLSVEIEDELLLDLLSSELESSGEVSLEAERTWRRSGIAWTSKKNSDVPHVVER